MLAALMAGALLLAGHGNLVSPAKLTQVLNDYLGKDGRLDYAALKGKRESLDAYVAAVADVSFADFDKSPRDTQMAYLINAYNAYAIQTVLDNYPKPIKSSGGLFGGPGNSLKQVKGAMNLIRHKTAVGNLSLDDLEKNLITTYQEPLVHMALNCAARGSPALRKEPYDADKLKAQVEDQASTFLTAKNGMVIKGDSIEISSLFKTDKADFEKKYQGPIGFIQKYSQGVDLPRVNMAIEHQRVSYLDFDWTLNDKE